MQTNELRLFVSSTFRDLMPEREVLVKKIFPKLRELCREHGVHFTEIDLRWGITAEEARTGKVVRICLEEIDKCRPYFIGIMGSRYGWQPGEDVLENDPALHDDFPWLAEYIAQGKSITEIEFLHGAIRSRNTQSAFIYSQHNTGEQTDDDITHLGSVRDSIRAVGVPLRTFLSADELGELVLADLGAVIERDFALTTEPDALTLMRQPHDAFSVNRRRSYVANLDYVKLFETFVNGEGSPLVFRARSGLGKSSLMAYLTHEYKEKHDAFVVTHFVGASASASGANDIIRHMMTEIKDRYSLSDELPTEDSRLREEFPLWLAKVKDEKLVLAIDALNQLPLVDNELGWLPEFIPPNVRLVVSTTEGISYDNIHKRAWQEVEVQPLDNVMRRTIAVDFLSRYHKTLTDDQFALISNNTKCESPLFLRTVLEELRVFGVYEEYETHLITCLESRDERELFQHVLSRLEGIFGKEKVRSVMRAIWAARYGLSENELLEITGLTRLDESLLLAGLEYHLMQQAGLYTFFHQYVREAVRERYVAGEEAEREAHAHIARYFADTPPTPRRRDEEPWQWIEAKEKEQAIETLTDISLFPLLAEEARQYELLGYWTKLEANDQIKNSYLEMFDKTLRGAFLLQKEDFYSSLGLFLRAASLFDAAEQPLEKALEIIKETSFGSQTKLAKAMSDLATVYTSQGKYNEAKQMFSDALAIYERENDLMSTSEVRANIASVLFSTSNYSEAVTLQEKAVSESIEAYGETNVIVAEQLNNLASILYYTKSYTRAEELLVQAISIDKKTYGETHPQTQKHFVNLANIYREFGRYEDAISIYTHAITLLQNIVGENYYSVANYFSSRSLTYLKMCRFADAEVDCKKALAIRTALFGADSYITTDTYFLLAEIYVFQGRNEDARKVYHQYFPKKKVRGGMQNKRVQKIAADFMKVLESLGRQDEIEALRSEIYQ